MNTFLKFLQSKDGFVALAGLILCSSVIYLNTSIPEVNFVARVGNLCLVLYVLWRVAGDKVVQLFVGRRAAIANELEELRQRKEDAERSLALLKERIANLSAEQEAILAESREQAEQLRTGILARAEKQAAEIREQASRSAGSQARTELAALRAEMADKIAEAVEKALQEKLNPESHAKLVEKSLKKVVLH